MGRRDVSRRPAFFYLFRPARPRYGFNVASHPMPRKTISNAMSNGVRKGIFGSNGLRAQHAQKYEPKSDLNGRSSNCGLAGNYRHVRWVDIGGENKSQCCPESDREGSVARTATAKYAGRSNVEWVKYVARCYDRRISRKAEPFCYSDSFLNPRRITF